MQNMLICQICKVDVFNQSLFPKASENGTIQLYKKMQAENLAREAEIAELRAKLERLFLILYIFPPAIIVIDLQ